MPRSMDSGGGPLVRVESTPTPDQGADPVRIRSAAGDLSPRPASRQEESRDREQEGAGQDTDSTNHDAQVLSTTTSACCRSGIRLDGGDGGHGGSRDGQSDRI